MRKAIFMLVIAVLLSSCGGGSHAVPPVGRGSGGVNGPPPIGSAQALYVANHVGCPPFPCTPGLGSVTTYAAQAFGNVSPLTQLSGPNTQLDLPTGITVSPSGDVYVMNQRAGSLVALSRVTKYAPGALGNTAPVSSFFVYPFGFAGSMAVDSHGDLLIGFDVFQEPGAKIFVYAPDTNAEFATPMRIITGPKVTADFALDKNRNFYFGTGSRIEEYPSTFTGSGTPIAVYQLSCETSPPGSIAIGADGNVYERSSAPDTVTVFSPAVNGTSRILAEITGPKTQPMPESLAVDAAGTIYLGGGDRIDVYHRGATGNVAPDNVIMGPATQLQSASGIALGPVPAPPGPTPVPSSTPAPNPNAATLFVSTLTNLDTRATAIEAFTNGVYGAPAYQIAGVGELQLLAVNSQRTLFASLGTSAAPGTKTVSVFPLGATTPAATIALPDLAAAIAIDGNDNVYVNARSALLEYSSANLTTPIRTLLPRSGFHFANSPKSLAVNKVLNEPAVFMSPDVCCGTGFIEVYGSTGTAAIHEIPYPNPRQDFFGQALAIDSTGEVYVTLGASSVPTLGFAPGETTASVTLPPADNVAVGTNDDVFLERRFTDSTCLIQNFSSTIAEYAPRSTTQLQNLHLQCRSEQIFANPLQVARDGTLYFSDVDHFVFPEVLIFSSLAQPPIAVRGDFVAERGIAVGP